MVKECNHLWKADDADNDGIRTTTSMMEYKQQHQWYNGIRTTSLVMEYEQHQ